MHVAAWKLFVKDDEVKGLKMIENTAASIGLLSEKMVGKSIWKGWVFFSVRARMWTILNR